jgi:hypothetical protein
VHVAEDIIFSLKAIYYANKVSECKDYLYNYYIREGSLMAFTNSKRRIENYLKSIDLVKHFLVKKNIFRKYEKEFLYFKFYNYLAIYGVMYYSKEELEKEHYKKIIEKDRDFSGIKILSLGINSVALGSILIKMKLFNPVFRIRELFRILVGRWGKRNL